MGIVTMTVASALYLFLLGLLLAVAYRPAWFHQWYALAKCAASVGFLALSLLAAVLSRQWPLFLMLLPGLVLCLAGDVLLGLANTRKHAFNMWFGTGGLCFALAHIAYVVAFRCMCPAMGFVQPWMALAPLALLAGTFFCCRSGAFRLKKLRVPALVYSFCVGCMCSAALRTGWCSGWSAQGALFAAGALLFVASDCILLFLYFYCKPRKALRALNLLTYYMGLGCFAWALFV